MAKFRVELYELHAQTYEVDAEDQEHALAMMAAGDGDEVEGVATDGYIRLADRYRGSSGLPDATRSVTLVK